MTAPTAPPEELLPFQPGLQPLPQPMYQAPQQPLQTPPQAIPPQTPQAPQPVYTAQYPQQYPLHGGTQQAGYAQQAGYVQQPGQTQQASYTTQAQPVSQTAPGQQSVSSVHINLPPSPAPAAYAVVKPEDPEDGKLGYFCLGFALSIILGIFAFLFFCCADATGLTPSRRGPFLIGTIVGFLIQTVVCIAVIVVYVI